VFLDVLGAAIKRHVPSEHIPEGDTEALFRIYAVLLQAKGSGVTNADVHDAWCTWMAMREPGHTSLVPFEQLPLEVKKKDSVYAAAIRKASTDGGLGVVSETVIVRALYPFGLPEESEQKLQAFELYKTIVASSENLVGRRQGVNTFFLTMNGVLFTAAGLIVQTSSDRKVAAFGIAVLTIMGAILCGAWASLIRSFGQLNSGKFRVIGILERSLSAAVYAAEWEALARGTNPKVYRTFTSREIWVPVVLLVIHVFIALAALAVVAEVLQLTIVSQQDFVL
jgi:hypothetical protein